MAEHPRLARGRVEQPGEHLQRRRLAGAVRAEEADDLAGPDLERDRRRRRAPPASSGGRGCCTAARRPGSRSGTRNILFRSATRTTGFRLDTPRTYPRARGSQARAVRILLVSQMYPSAAAPDFGVFVQGLERELAALGPRRSSASCSTVAAAASGGTSASRARDLARVAPLPAGRRLRALPRPDRPLGARCRAPRRPLVVTAHGQDVANAVELAPVRPRDPARRPRRARP